MSDDIDKIDDALWQRIELLVGRRPRRAKRAAGRPPADDRQLLAGIVYVLRSGIRWNRLPARLGFGSGMTCLRRLRAWQRSGAWRRIENELRFHLPEAARIDWQRASRRRKPRRRGRQSPPELSGGSAALPPEEHSPSTILGFFAAR
ncbi:MAG TPA: transposase [Pirellulales bacterium]|nr:transposase [Pirellulales bacterium]